MSTAPDTIAIVYSAGIAVVAISGCVHASGSIVRVRGARFAIITACLNMKALSFEAVIEGAGIFVVAILRSMHACLPIEGIDGARIVIVAVENMPGHKPLIQGLGCAVISAINKDGLINASSGFAGIESAVISIIAIPRSINAGCTVVAIYGAGVAIITDYPGRYILSVTLRFVTGNILFNVTNIGFRNTSLPGF
jgi:hypothetical protein